MNPKLTSRDIALLMDVYKYRYLSGTQLERLHFPSKRTAYRRLQALTRLKCVKAFSSPNIPERLFYLDSEGAAIVAGEMHVTVSDLQWYRYAKTPKDYFFIKHFLAINDFRILLTQACAHSPMKLLGFIPEYVGEKTTQGNVKKYIRDNVCDISKKTLTYSHTPDAVFALEKEGNAALFFAEIDRGTEIVSDPEKGFLKCVVFYLNYWVEKKWQRYQDDFGREFQTFRTLIVTTSKERLAHMREATTRLPFRESHVKRFLWGTIQSQTTPDWIFESIWHSLDVNDPTLYRIG
jgi:Replication-relaxation